MSNECNIVRDLLPLYAEHMASSDTAEFVEAHLKGCAACSAELARIREPQPAWKGSDAAALRRIGRKMKIRRMQTVVMTALFAMALFVSLAAMLDAPVYLPYREGRVTLAKTQDGALLLTFDEAVKDFRCTVYEDPNGGDFYCCDVSTWTSAWAERFAGERGGLSAVVATEQEKPIRVVYVPNDGTALVSLAQYDPHAEDPIKEDVRVLSGVELPRLTLGYYALFAIAACAVLAVLRFAARKRAACRVWIERIGLYPIAYLISHFAVAGIDWATYSLVRDFARIVFLSLLLYGGLLLAHGIRRERRESRAIDG